MQIRAKGFIQRAIEENKTIKKGREGRTERGREEGRREPVPAWLNGN